MGRRKYRVWVRSPPWPREAWEPRSGAHMARGAREEPVRVVEDGNLTSGIWTHRRVKLGQAEFFFLPSAGD